MTLSLRDRLLAGLVVLVALGLVAFGVANYTALRGFLYQRVDDQLRSGRGIAYGQLFQDQGGRGFPGGARGGPGGPLGPQLPPGSYAAAVDGSGSVVRDHVFEFGDTSSTARPVLPNPLPRGTQDAPALLTVPGTGGVAEYRLLVEAAPGTDDTLVLAIPLADVDSTLTQLLQLEALLGAIVLLLLSLFALWMIRVGLRPLERMGETAAAIAAGDLSRRVAPATSRTEIGRLGIALNAMLGQIEHAFRRREASEHQLRQFLADASHELRTPLTSIRGYAEMLRRGAGASPGDAELARSRIEAEAVRMGVLVDDLLLLARLDQGRPLERVRVDLRSLARDACADARAAAPDRRITLRAASPVMVEGDEARLRQVVGNLVRNAVVHTPPRTPIELSVEQVDGHAELAVVDHGPGLPKGAEERVFEPFFRADPGRSRDTGGSGLGLSIVAAVVAAHGGRVEAVPTSGGGATFRVDLPLAAA